MGTASLIFWPGTHGGSAVGSSGNIDTGKIDRVAFLQRVPF